MMNTGSQPVQNPVFNPTQNHLRLSSALRTCSVRGCSQPLLSESINKMCEGCRGRHRVYASTKRAKRKLEKAAVASIRRVGDQYEVCGVSPSIQTQVAWAQPPQSTSSQSSVTANENNSTTWDSSAIDPQLFAESTAASIHHHSIVTAFSQPPYPSSSSSELAGALTLPPSSSRNASITAPDSNFYTQSVHTAEKTDNNYSTAGLEVALSLQTTGNAELECIADGGLGEMVAQKPCSVKGCKAMISYSSTYKMCTPCRTRYRTYGNTKRAKWRAEREAFDLELVGLKTKEDTGQKTTGEQSLPDTPGGLHQWDLPMMDENSQSTSENGVMENTSISGDDTMIMMQSTVYPNGSSADENVSTPMTDDTSFQLPARMCTVSHCHKILPGFYRYKRCAQHRLQNRYHSHLKRIREKGEKAILLDSVSAHEGVPGPSTAGEASQLGLEQEDMITADGQSKSGSEQVDQPIRSGKKKPRKRPSTCLTSSCYNLLTPGVCWLYCDVCRAIKRVYRREEKASKDYAGQGGDQERLKEIAGLMEASGIDSRTRRERGMSATTDGEEPNGKVSGRRGKTGAKKAGDQVKVAPMTTTPLIRPIAPASTSPQVAASTGPDVPASSSSVTGTETNDHTATPYTQAFQSVFRADITALPPPPTDHMDRTPTTMTTFITTVAKPVNQSTDGGQLTIREYRPKTRVGGGPALSQGAEAFREMVQKEQQTSHGVVGPPSYHVYRSTPPPFRPASASITSASESESTATSSFLIVDDPLSKKARTQSQDRVSGNANSESTSKNVDAPSCEPSNSPAVHTASTGQEFVANQPNVGPQTTFTSTSPPPPTVSRQRKPRTPRAKPAPQVPAVPTPSTSAYPYSSSQYPYPSSQYPYPYPYPYYMPPYGYSMPRTAPSLPSTMPHPSYPYSYPYPYPYTPSLGAYSSGYGYLQSPHRYPLGSYSQHQPTMSLIPQQQPYTPTSSYSFLHSKVSPYHQPPAVALPPTENPKKRKREEKEDEQAARMVDHYAPIGRLSPPAPMVQPQILPVLSGDTQNSADNPPGTSHAISLAESPPASIENTAPTNLTKVVEPSTSPPHTATRICAHRACHRTIPADHFGNLCERCRVRIKRHQAKTKERLKLEPRKSILIGRVKASARISSASADAEVA